MGLGLALLVTQLVDYVAKVALLSRLVQEPGLRLHFWALVFAHVAANMRSASAALCRPPNAVGCVGAGGAGGKRCRVPCCLAPAVVLLLGVATPLLQVLHVRDALVAACRRRRGVGPTPRMPLAPLDVVMEGSVFVLLTMHIHCILLLGRVAVAPVVVSASLRVSPWGATLPPWGATLATLLIVAGATSLVNVTTSLLMWDSAVSLTLARGIFKGQSGWRHSTTHAVFRGNEFVGRAALLAIVAAVMPPKYAAGYLVASYLAHLLLFVVASSPTSLWSSAVLAWPILFVNLPQYVDSPKHAASAQSVASLVCGLRALELAVAGSAAIAVVLLEPGRGDVGRPAALVDDVLEALQTLCRRRVLVGLLGLCLLLYYRCMLVRWCRVQAVQAQADTSEAGEGGKRLGSSGFEQSSDPATPVLSPDSPEVNSFWPPALDLSSLLLRAACQREVPKVPGHALSGPSPWGPGRSASSSDAGPVGRHAARDGPRMQDFDMIRTIGCGEFGQVCQVRWRATQEIFAMKRLSKLEYARRRITEKARREVMTLTAARGHPFVVELYFAIESVHEWALIMEYCPHGDLQQLLLAEGCPGLDLGRILKIASEVTLALEHLHSRGIAYRDLKLENIVLGQDGHAKLTDFGLAKQIEGGGDAVAEAERQGGAYTAFTWTFCGSYGYTAPEVSLRRQVHGFAVDMYSFGVLLLMLLMGGEVHHIEQGPPWESRLPPETPGQLKAVLDRLSFDFYWASHCLLKPARASHRVEVNLNGEVVVASRRSRTSRRPRAGDISRPPTSPRVPQSPGRLPMGELPSVIEPDLSALPPPASPQSPASPTIGPASAPHGGAGAASRPVHFPALGVDCADAQVKWDHAIALIRLLVDEQPELRGNVATLRRHAFFDSVLDWRLVYPRSWLRERVVAQLRAHAGGRSLPRGAAGRLETLAAEELAALLDDDSAQLAFLAQFSLPRAELLSPVWTESGNAASLDRQLHEWVTHYP